VPHVDTVEQARRLVEAFRFPPMGHRSAGGPPAQFGYRPPPQPEAQAILNKELLVVAMIETPKAVENADAIAGVAGIDGLLIGTNDLSNEMGITAQPGHEKVQAAYRKVGQACQKHGKLMGMGGVYDQEWSSRYIEMGARFVLAASDHGLLMDAGTKRTDFLRKVLAAKS
jgi:2-keto-3-deoxy-L-rhamnonate aldolase RhmA